MGTKIGLMVLILTIITLSLTCYWYFKKRGIYYPFRSWEHVKGRRGAKDAEVYAKYKQLRKNIETSHEAPAAETFYHWQINLLVLFGLRKKYIQSNHDIQAENEFHNFQNLILEALKEGIRCIREKKSSELILHDASIWELLWVVFDQEDIATLLRTEAQSMFPYVLSPDKKMLACAEALLGLYREAAPRFKRAKTAVNHEAGEVEESAVTANPDDKNAFETCEAAVKLLEEEVNKVKSPTKIQTITIPTLPETLTVIEVAQLRLSNESNLFKKGHPFNPDHQKQ